MHLDGFTHDELQFYKALVLLNILTSVKQLIRGMDSLEIDYGNLKVSKSSSW